MSPYRRMAGGLLLLIAACSGGDNTAEPDREQPSSTESSSSSFTSTSGSETTADTTAARPLAEVEITLSPIGEFDEPIVWVTHPDGESYVGEKAGRIRAVASGEVALDLSDVVTAEASEQGLLGLAFHPDGERLYTSYSEQATDGDSVIAEYAFGDGQASSDSAREILRLDQPFANHNGGGIAFGPDGYLYIGFGDGGSGGDPNGNGQDPSTLLATILRIDPTNPSGSQAYSIPPDNPFASGGGAAEVYLYGVRNPWRFSFDSATEDLWIADVGQNAWEEINLLPADQGRGLGANLGWSLMEGNHEFNGSAPEGATAPIHEYSRDEGCSVTGGFVYRGEAIPGLGGAYLFTDYCRSDLRAIRYDGNEVTEHRAFPVEISSPVSFGEDANGELVVLSQGGTVYRIEPAT